MDNMKDAFLRLVKALKKVKTMSNAFACAGIYESPVRDALDEISDAIYKLVGESAEEWQKSVTYTILEAPYLTDERRAEMLASEYRKHHSEPKPVLNHFDPKPVDKPANRIYFSKEDFDRMYETIGGYRYEGPEEITLCGAMTALKECGQELCKKCGGDKDTHINHCFGCRWQYVKDGRFPV